MLDIQIANLPSVTVNQTERLPKCPGCYFILDGETVLYVGQSCNIRKRWHRHHRENQARSVAGVTIAWLETKTRREAAQLEQLLILQFRPLWNGSRVVTGLMAAPTAPPGPPPLSPRDQRLTLLVKDCDRVLDFFGRNAIPQNPADLNRLFRTILMLKVDQDCIVGSPKEGYVVTNLLYKHAINGQGIYKDAG